MNGKQGGEVRRGEIRRMKYKEGNEGKNQKERKRKLEER